MYYAERIITHNICTKLLLLPDVNIPGLEGYRGSSSLTPDAVFNSLGQLSNPILGKSSDSKKIKNGHPHKFKIRPLRPVVKRKSINFLEV